MRPEGTEGMGEDELAALVTRDSMIGTGLAKAPPGRAA
jgi:nitrile hydratase